MLDTQHTIVYTLPYQDKGLKMKKLTKEELDGCYINYDEYATACLIEMGLNRTIVDDKAKYIKMSDVSFMEDNNKDWLDYEAKRIYFHKGNFYSEPHQEKVQK